MSVPGTARGQLRRSYDVVVIGAGVQGLATAFELARRGAGAVCVVDATYPGAGASGRNGELIRSAFASAEWIGLFDLSLRRWHSLSALLDFNVLFTPAGYLVVAADGAGAARLQRQVERQRSMGLATALLSAREVLEVAPALNPAAVRAGVYQATGGFAHHDAVVWGYARAAARLGVEIHPFTEVTGIRADGAGVAGVITARGPIATRTVVDAAGGQARAVAAFAGVALATRTLRLEAVVTESVRPFLRPAVALVDLLGYCHQTTRGEFVGGTEQRHMPEHTGPGTSLRALRDACQKFVHAFPGLAGVRLVRQWSGLVDVAPDLAPVLGPAPELDGLWLSAGWVYGFMGAPAAGLLLAEAITTGQVPDVMRPFGVERLRDGTAIEEESLVVPREDTPG